MRFINWTLDHQQSSGMIGPVSNDDWWPRMVMLKVLAQYHDATGDRRVIPVMTKYFQYQLSAMPQRPLSSWGKYRWQDEAMVVVWLHRKTGDPRLLQLFELLQQQGYDWVAEFQAFPYKVPQTRALLKMQKGAATIPNGMETHGVNNGQALKVAAVRHQMTGGAEEKANFDRQIEELYRYHGVPNGMFSCDEHLAGLNPSQGTELCTIVETMFSLEVALQVFGDPKIADRLEKIAFNALPGTFTDDMWAHQYDQQSNQIRVSRNSKPWTTNGPESNLFGLEPNFGCCTANFHQGWPKLTEHLWMRTPNEGLAAVVWAPCIVRTSVHGEAVSIRVATEYPFQNTVDISLSCASPKSFPLALRIPEWSAKTKLLINGKDANIDLQPATFAKIEREWKDGDHLRLEFEMRTELHRSFQQSVFLTRGPLVFSHSPGEIWIKLRDHGPTADWQVYGEKPWAYALAVDEQSAVNLKVTESPIGARPFAAKDTGVKITVPAKRLSSWLDVDGVANPIPMSPEDSHEPMEMLELIPYAAAKLRVTAFPQLTEAAATASPQT
ncbi:MAG TPA: beta-L-arabinofuranosidase domain-containing protein [Bryocella sp.]|nr:beta-L-arabinofuranosidase domain-containing protein [Bryocella sp.]